MYIAFCTVVWTPVEHGSWWAAGCSYALSEEYLKRRFASDGVCVFYKEWGHSACSRMKAKDRAHQGLMPMSPQLHILKMWPYLLRWTSKSQKLPIPPCMCVYSYKYKIHMKVFNWVLPLSEATGCQIKGPVGGVDTSLWVDDQRCPVELPFQII